MGHLNNIKDKEPALYEQIEAALCLWFGKEPGLDKRCDAEPNVPELLVLLVKDPSKLRSAIKRGKLAIGNELGHLCEGANPKLLTAREWWACVLKQLDPEARCEHQEEIALVASRVNNPPKPEP